jgi:hypothetical protein
MGKEENKINQSEKKVIIEQNGKSSSNINHNPNFGKDIKSVSALVIAIWYNFPLPQFDEGLCNFLSLKIPKIVVNTQLVSTQFMARSNLIRRYLYVHKFADLRHLFADRPPLNFAIR